MINNKSVFVTGATNGTGFAIAERFAKEGYSVFIGSRRQNDADIAAKDIADKYNCDIGDHVLNSSGLNGTPTVEDCVYCKDFSSGCSRIVYESQHFLVVPTVGEFITGYLLIIPKRHTMSLAEFTEVEFSEFLQVLDDVRYILDLTYKTSDFLIFENGTGKSGKGKA